MSISVNFQLAHVIEDATADNNYGSDQGIGLDGHYFRHSNNNRIKALKNTRCFTCRTYADNMLVFHPIPPELHPGTFCLGTSVEVLGRDQMNLSVQAR